MAKYDIKDGFWRLDCAEGEEWNFAYVLPQHYGDPTRLVVPTSLQMGWVESPAFFCAASEMGSDVAQQYAETKVESLPRHKFLDHSMASTDVEMLPAQKPGPLKYLVDVYVDDYINVAIPTSKEQLEHVSNAVLHGIHDVFPANSKDELDPISHKKFLKKEGAWALVKDILGFEFDGSSGAKTIQLEEQSGLCSSSVYNSGFEQAGTLRLESRFKSSDPSSPRCAMPSFPFLAEKDCSARATIF
jgi:hypothetical protein